jgi:hypothetical protein
MAKIDNGGPAFPGIIFFDEHPCGAEQGMSLRDYFAAHAPPVMQYEIDQEVTVDKMRNPHADPHKPKRRSMLEIRTELAYRWADAMIATSNKEGK